MFLGSKRTDKFDYSQITNGTGDKGLLQMSFELRALFE